MAESYKIGPNLVGAIYDVIQANKDAGGGRPPPTRLPTTFGEGPPEFRGVRVGTYNGLAWPKNGQKTVTLTNVGVTGYTVLATNVIDDVADRGEYPTNCEIAKDGTAWYLIQPMASGGGLVAGRFTGAWGLSTDKVVTRLSNGATVNVTNIIYDIPDVGTPLRCVFGAEGSTWYLANVEHRSTSVLTRVAIEGSTFVFNRSAIQIVGDTMSPTTFPLDVCNTYTNTTTITTTSSSGGASGAATSYFMG